MCAPAPIQPRSFARPVTKGVRLTFTLDVDFHEVELTLELSLLAARSLHGDDAVTVDADWCVDPDQRAITVATDTKAGRTLALTFLGFTRREFGDAAVSVFRFTAGVGGRP